MHEVTEKMLAAAMKKAVELGLIPSHALGEEEYIRLWRAVEQIVQSAIDQQ